MRLVSWFASVTGWDGVLPLVGVASVTTVKLVFPRNDVAEVAVAIFVPMIVALVRAAIAVNQIKNRCQGVAPWMRQVALAAAIVLLFLFEIGSSILTLADDEPMAAWIGPVVLYLAYLTCIVWSLRPMLNESP